MVNLRDTLPISSIANNFDIIFLRFKQIVYDITTCHHHITSILRRKPHILWPMFSFVAQFLWNSAYINASLNSGVFFFNCSISTILHLWHTSLSAFLNLRLQVSHLDMLRGYMNLCGYIIPHYTVHTRVVWSTSALPLEVPEKIQVPPL